MNARRGYRFESVAVGVPTSESSNEVTAFATEKSAPRQNPELPPGFDKPPEFRKFYVNHPDLPSLWGKLASSGFLIGNGKLRRHAHAYIARGGESARQLGAHVKDERTGEHILEGRSGRWVLTEDLRRLGAWYLKEAPGFYLGLLDGVLGEARVATLKELVDPPHGHRGPRWRPVPMSTVFRALEKDPGVYVLDPGTMSRAAELMSQATPELLLRDHSTSKGRKTSDSAWRCPVRRRELVRRLRAAFPRGRKNLLERLRDRGHPPALIEAYGKMVWWLVNQLFWARSETLYLVLPWRLVERLGHRVLDWMISGADATFEGKDWKDLLARLRVAIQAGRTGKEVDLVKILNVDVIAMLKTLVPEDAPVAGDVQGSSSTSRLPVPGE